MVDDGVGEEVCSGSGGGDDWQPRGTPWVESSTAVVVLVLLVVVEAVVVMVVVEG